MHELNITSPSEQPSVYPSIHPSIQPADSPSKIRRTLEPLRPDHVTHLPPPSSTASDKTNNTKTALEDFFGMQERRMGGACRTATSLAVSIVGTLLSRSKPCAKYADPLFLSFSLIMEIYQAAKRLGICDRGSGVRLVCCSSCC